MLTFDKYAVPTIDPGFTLVIDTSFNQSIANKLISLQWNQSLKID